MSSAVFVTFLDSPIQHTIPFNGPAISVRDLKAILPSFCKLKTSIYDLHILDKDGTDYTNEDDLIISSSNLVAKKILKNKGPFNASKFKPAGLPPDSYRCNKCHEVGHWIYDCPGLFDIYGRPIDLRSVKRPTGIPKRFLLEVPPGTSGAYLTREGKYMMPLNDHEVHVKNKEITPIFAENKSDEHSLLNFQESNYQQFPESLNSTHSMYSHNVIESQTTNTNNISFSVFTPHTSSANYSSFNAMPIQRDIESPHNEITPSWLKNNTTYESIPSTDEFIERRSELRTQKSHHDRSRSPLIYVKPRDRYREYDEYSHSRRDHTVNDRERCDTRYEYSNSCKKTYRDRRDS